MDGLREELVAVQAEIARINKGAATFTPITDEYIDEMCKRADNGGELLSIDEWLAQ